MNVCIHSYNNNQMGVCWIESASEFCCECYCFCSSERFMCGGYWCLCSWRHCRIFTQFFFQVSLKSKYVWIEIYLCSKIVERIGNNPEEEKPSRPLDTTIFTMTMCAYVSEIIWEKERKCSYVKHLTFLCANKHSKDNFIIFATLKMNKRMCYVCRQWININKLNGLHVKTIYTKTKIVEHIRRLLAADNPISVSENASICLQCLHKFNQYDLACTTVERVQAELRRDLLSSEGIESKEDVIESVQSVRAGKGDGFLGNSRYVFVLNDMYETIKWPLLCSLIFSYQKEPGNRIGAAVCLAQEIMDESLDNGEIKQESSELRTRADPENNPVDGTL